MLKEKQQSIAKLTKSRDSELITPIIPVQGMPDQPHRLSQQTAVDKPVSDAAAAAPFVAPIVVPMKAGSKEIIPINIQIIPQLQSVVREPNIPRTIESPTFTDIPLARPTSAALSSMVPEGSHQSSVLKAGTSSEASIINKTDEEIVSRQAPPFIPTGIVPPQQPPTQQEHPPNAD